MTAPPEEPAGPSAVVAGPEPLVDVIAAARFPLRGEGYDPASVDAFLDRLGSEAAAATAAVPSPAAMVTAPPGPERIRDQWSEMGDRVARVLASADRESTRVLDEAEARAQAMLEEAQAEAEAHLRAVVAMAKRHLDVIEGSAAEIQVHLQGLRALAPSSGVRGHERPPTGLPDP